MKLIKLTKNGETKDNTKWEIGQTVSIANDKRKPELCSDGMLHAYESIEQALAMNVWHNNIDDEQLKIFEVTGNIEVSKYDKVGSYELTPTKEVPLPDWYLNEDLRKKIFVRFVCYCALESIDIFEEKYPNNNRPRKVIEEAMKYGSDEFDADATSAACDAARDAIHATYDTDVAYAIYAAEAAYTATYVATNATHTATNTAHAIYVAHLVAPYMDITGLMKKAIGDFI